MPQASGLSPTRQRIQVTKRSNIVTALCHDKSQRVSITIHIQSMKRLKVAGAISLSPQAFSGS
jgi:hypothetical protein